MLFSPPGFEHYDYTTLVPKLASQVPSIKHFVMLNDIHAKYRLVSSPLKSVGYEQYLSQSGSLLDLSPFEMKGQHDIVNVQFTSGSTGLPKAVALSHYKSKQLARRGTGSQPRRSAAHVQCCPESFYLAL